MSTLHQVIKKFGFVFLLISTLIIPAYPVSAQDDPPEFPQSNFWTRTTPSVFFCDDPGTMTMELHVVGRSDVARVLIFDPYGETKITEGNITSPYSELLDDGTHGDETAGDNVFTHSGLRPYCSDENTMTWGYGFTDYYPTFELRDGAKAISWYTIRIGVVDPKYRGQFEVQDLGNGLSATSHAFFIHDMDNEVMSGYPVSDVSCGKGNYEAYKKLYSVLPDSFDMALVTPGVQMLRQNGFAENVPYNVNVANSVRNIGLPIVDHTARFGSAGRLRSTMYNSFGGLDVMEHEIAHTWGAGLGGSLNLLDPESLGHWNPLTDIGGQLGAFYITQSAAGAGKFRDNGDGTWQFIANIDSEQNEPYSPLELYAMGLIPAYEVPAVHRFIGAPDLSDPQKAVFKDYKTIAIEDILRVEGGERIPSSAESPKEFTMAYIVTLDIPYDEAAYTYHSLMAYHLTTKEPPETTPLTDGQLSAYRYFMPFYWATGGRATLETRLPIDLPDPVGLPGMAPIQIEPTNTVEQGSPVATETLIEPSNGAQTSSPQATETPKSGKPGLCSPLPVGMLLAFAGYNFSRKRK